MTPAPRRALATASGTPPRSPPDEEPIPGEPLPEGLVSRLRVYDYGFTAALFLLFGMALNLIGNPINLIRKPESLHVAEDILVISPKLQEKLGSPLKTGSLNWGGAVDEQRGIASFEIEVSGPKGTAVVHTKLARTRGRWEPFMMEAEGSAGGKKWTTDLLEFKYAPAKPTAGSDAEKRAAAHAAAAAAAHAHKK